MKIFNNFKNIINFNGYAFQWLILLLIFFWGWAAFMLMTNFLITFNQILIITFLLVISLFTFYRPGTIGLVILILMFIPLSIGLIGNIMIVWVFEPLVFLLFMSLIFKGFVSKEKLIMISRRTNPFFIPIIIYIIVLVLNYIRYPMTASSIAGTTEESGGIRFYFEKAILIAFFFSIMTLVASDEKYNKKITGILLNLSILLTLTGIILMFSEPFYKIILNMQKNQIFALRGFMTGSWNRSVDLESGSIRTFLLWISPIGILLLISGLAQTGRKMKILLLIFFTIGLILSATRSFFFGVLVALAIWSFLIGKPRRIAYIIIIGIIIYFISTISQGFFSNQAGRLFFYSQDLEELSTGRFSLFQIYSYGFLRHPLFGVGVGATEIGKISLSSAAYFINQNMRFGGHSFFLGTLYTMGIVGLMPFIIIYAVTIKLALKLYRIGTDHYRDISLFSLMFIGYTIIPFIAGGYETFSQFFIVVGMLAGTNARMQLSMLDKNGK